MNSERFRAMRNCQRGFYIVPSWDGKWHFSVHRTLWGRFMALFTGV